MKTSIELEKELVKSIELSKVLVSRYVIYVVSRDTIELSHSYDDNSLLVLDLTDSDCSFSSMSKNEILDYVRETGVIDALSSELIQKGGY
jgi:hypothetical protein